MVTGKYMCLVLCGSGSGSYGLFIYCYFDCECVPFCSQHNTIWLSVQRGTAIGWSAGEREAWANFANLVAVTAAISSSLGSVKALIGATRLLDITNEISLLLRR